MSVTLPNEVIPALWVVLALILIDTVLAICLKLKTKEFDVSKLPQFLITGVLPYTGGLIVLAVIARTIGVFYNEMFYIAATAVMGKYVNDVRLKIMGLFGTLES